MPNVRAGLYEFYRAAQGVLAPGLMNSQYAYRDALARSLDRNIRWLDLGCGHNLLPEWMQAQAEEAAMAAGCRMVVGIDADLPSLRKHGTIGLRVLGNIEQLPFADESFDLVTANVVVEHVQCPAELLAEVRRVLAPGGTFLFHTPNLHGYTSLISAALPNFAKVWLARLLQGRKHEDVFPTFYRMNTEAAIKGLAQECGFEISAFRLQESSAQTVMLGPLVIPELLWIRILRFSAMARFRTNLIVALKKMSTFPRGEVLESAANTAVARQV